MRARVVVEQLRAFLRIERTALGRTLTTWLTDDELTLQARRTSRAIEGRRRNTLEFANIITSLSAFLRLVETAELESTEPVVFIDHPSKALSEFLTKRGYVRYIEDGASFYLPVKQAVLT